MHPHASFLHPFADQSAPEPLSGGPVHELQNATQQPRKIPLVSTNFAQQHASENFALSLTCPQTPFHDEPPMVTLELAPHALLMEKAHTNYASPDSQTRLNYQLFAQLMMMKGVSLSPRWEKNTT